MRNFVSKTRNCVSKTRNFVLKIMIFAGDGLGGAERACVQPASCAGTSKRCFHHGLRDARPFQADPASRCKEHAPAGDGSYQPISGHAEDETASDGCLEHSCAAAASCLAVGTRCRCWRGRDRGGEPRGAGRGEGDQHLDVARDADAPADGCVMSMY